MPSNLGNFSNISDFWGIPEISKIYPPHIPIGIWKIWGIPEMPRIWGILWGISKYLGIWGYPKFLGKSEVGLFSTIGNFSNY